MAYITQRDLAMLPNTLLIPIKSIIRTPKTVCKFEINSVLCFLRTNMRTTDPAAQGSLFFFHDLRWWGMQWLSSPADIWHHCWVEQEKNPIHFQLLYSLTVDPVSKHKGEGIQSNTHTSGFQKTLGFDYLGGSGTRGGGRERHNTAFKTRCWPKE